VHIQQPQRLERARNRRRERLRNLGKDDYACTRHSTIRTPAWTNRSSPRRLSCCETRWTTSALSRTSALGMRTRSCPKPQKCSRSSTSRLSTRSTRPTLKSSGSLKRDCPSGLSSIQRMKSCRIRSCRTSCCPRHGRCCSILGLSSRRRPQAPVRLTISMMPTTM
jgi:hypothetical protein